MTGVQTCALPIYNYFSTGRWGDSREYDLCVNSRIGIDAVVEIIKTAAGHLAEKL